MSFMICFMLFSIVSIIMQREVCTCSQFRLGVLVVSASCCISSVRLHMLFIVSMLRMN